MYQTIRAARAHKKWNKEIDDLLRTLVSVNGTNDWTKIATTINIEISTATVEAQQCEDRWRYLDYNDSKKPWTEEEELDLFIAHKKYKNRWSDVAEALGKRSNNTIKNKFYSIFRKIKNKITRMDLTYESNLEVAEAFYVMKLMENHIARPTSSREKVGKRGKDFIYSLLKGLDMKEIANYKRELNNLGIKEIKLEDYKLNIKKPVEQTHESKLECKNLIIEMFPFITENSKHDNIKFTLPLPHAFNTSQRLTREEKTHIYTQFFRQKEPKSAVVLTDNSSYFNLTTRSQAPFSAGYVEGMARIDRFEGFSDYTANKKRTEFSKPFQ